MLTCYCCTSINSGFISWQTSEESFCKSYQVLSFAWVQGSDNSGQNIKNEIYEWKQVWLGRAHIQSMHNEGENLQIHQEQKIESFGEIRQLELCRILK